MNESTSSCEESRSGAMVVFFGGGEGGKARILLLWETKRIRWKNAYERGRRSWADNFNEKYLYIFMNALENG